MSRPRERACRDFYDFLSRALADEGNDRAAFVPGNLVTGDIIIADQNFGCGSSREHAPLAMKAAGISCVIAKSFARIFYRNSFNMGLPIFESPETVDNTAAGDELEVDVTSGEIVNLTRNKKFKANPIPPFIQELIASGGLMKYAQKKQMKKD